MQEAGHDLIKAIKKETSGDYEKALSRIGTTFLFNLYVGYKGNWSIHYYIVKSWTI